MTEAQLEIWLKGKRIGPVILVCPRCHKVDINPSRHLDECDPDYEDYRQESEDNVWK